MYERNFHKIFFSDIGKPWECVPGRQVNPNQIFHVIEIPRPWDIV
jgi:hypothetical protein